MRRLASNGTDLCQNNSSHIESNLDRLELLPPTHGQRSQQQSERFALQSVLINKPKFFKATRREEIASEKCSTVVHGGGGLEPVKLTREPNLAAQSPVYP